jgi:hypothetical protein
MTTLLNKIKPFGLIVLSLCSASLFAQWVPPTIDKASIDVSVIYNSTDSVYQYRYTINNPVENIGQIDFFSIDASGESTNPSTLSGINYGDGTMFKDYSKVSHVVVGVDSGEHWESAISMDGSVSWGQGGDSRFYIKPGSQLSGFNIYSMAPPGLREFQLTPYVDMGPGTPYDIYKEECDGDNPLCPASPTFWITGKMIGPTPPINRTLINGKGQRSSDVNQFLRYANPTDSTTVALPVGTTSYPLAVVFGNFVEPVRFSAVHNGVDISDQFNVYVGQTAVVNLPLHDGRNKLVISISGVRNDGRSATDTDQLTFIVK